MTTRNLIRELVVSYLNTRHIKYAPIKEITREVKPHTKGIDVYRIIYGLGLNDPGFDIVKDEETTYIRLV